MIYDPVIFDQQFAGRFRFAAAGFYNGVIAIRGTTRLTHDLSRVLHHELVHAALDAAAPALIFPGWFNEGLAEWFEARAQGKRNLSRGELEYLARARQAGALMSFSQLSAPSFVGFGPQAAGLAYLQSYGMIEYLARNYGERKLRQFCAELIRSRNLYRSLSRVYRTDLATLEASFFGELG